jgi:hypothetical protein
LGDTSLITDAIGMVRKIHGKAYCGQDSIFDMCGVCDEWRAADEVCRATRQVIEYLEDVLWHVQQGTSSLAIAHVHHTLKYQQDRLLAL